MLIQHHRARVIFIVDSLSAKWLAAEGEVSHFSFLCHLLSLSPLCLVGNRQGLRWFTSRGGKSDGKEEVERQTMEWKGVLKKERESKRDRGKGRSKKRAPER